jgi:antirestriction protein ArdC
MGQNRFDIHSHITQSIISAIEAGPGEFRLPWHRSRGNVMRPVNALTKNAYQGVNIVALWAQAELAGYTSGQWGTFQQWVRRESRMKGVTLWVHEQCPALSPHPAGRAGNGTV